MTVQNERLFSFLFREDFLSQIFGRTCIFSGTAEMEVKGISSFCLCKETVAFMASVFFHLSWFKD